MSVSKYFQSLTRKYYFLSPNIRFAKFASRSYSKIIDENHRLPSHYLSVHPDCYAVNDYTSQASRAEPIHKECTSIHSLMQSIKFEDMSFKPSVPHEELLAALRKCETLTEQMETLASTLALTSEDIENRKKFCKTLELFFKPFFEDFKIQMFGSSVNHFGFKGCDIDMSFETSVQPNDETSYLEEPDVPFVSEVVSGKVSPQDISKLPFKEQLKFIRDVLLEYYKESSEPSKLVEAVPLVRLYHDKFNLKCDLTFKNKVAFANTKLLYFYAKLDKRVVPLIMTLRYWAKHIELIGKGLVFNTYTITLLVIHFLQTRNPPVLPSAESILSLSKNFETNDMDDKSFLNLIEKIPPSNNTQPLDELLKEFFFYYLYFDFTRVIVPLTGTSVPRKEFISTKDRKFKINTLCVQDPLCTPHNVAELVDYKIAKKLQTECVTVCRMIQDNVISTPTSDTWGLMNILDKPKRYDSRNVDVGIPVLLTLPYIGISLNDGISLRSQASLTAKMLMKVLTHVLFFECTHIEEDKILCILERLDMDRKAALQKKHLESIANGNFELRKLRKDKTSAMESNEEQMESLSGETGFEQFKKFKAENELILCCKCKISKNVWASRQLIKLNPANMPSDILNREHFISKELVKQSEQNSEDQKKKSLEYLFECYIASNTPEPSILVNFRPLLKTDFNLVFAIFLRDYIPKIMRSTDI